ncbi:hypothetical protein MTBLM5_200033 [Magnetospirillum sp. LM-5]|nr:hypothetical protein MTBLM5_200033 [Magnetospirillum sp. LM-5]
MGLIRGGIDCRVKPGNDEQEKLIRILCSAL